MFLPFGHTKIYNRYRRLILNISHYAYECMFFSLMSIFLQQLLKLFIHNGFSYIIHIYVDK